VSRREHLLTLAALSIAARIQRQGSGTVQSFRDAWTGSTLPGRAFDEAFDSIARMGHAEVVAGVAFWTGPSIETFDYTARAEQEMDRK